MPMISVLLMASGAGWESGALARLAGVSGLVVLKRCVDVDDLLATATSGQADVAVVGLEAPGLDPAAIGHLRRYAVRPVGVAPGDLDLEALARAERLGITALVAIDDLDALPELVATVEDMADTRVRSGDLDHPDAAALSVEPEGSRHRCVAVWGPGGAPGRTTVAVSMAAELARRGDGVVLVDADPYGGGVAQQLGILDEVSGLLSAARLVGVGQLADRFSSTARRIGDHLEVITGLPRADRWIEVRPAQLEALLDHARARGEVVVDTGFSLEDDPGSDFGARPTRNAMTLTALEMADEIVVVGVADPPGLARLARGLVDLRDVTGGAAVRVVVNRMRPSLGWSQREIAGMVEGFSRISGLHFLPDDQASTDRALVAGTSLVEGSDSALVRALGSVVDSVFPTTVVSGAPRRRGVGRRGARR